MRIVALEEHISFPSFAAELNSEQVARRGGSSGGAGPLRAELEDVDKLRIPSMDENGITVQVLSVPGPGAAMVETSAAPDYAKRYNDAVAAAARRHPGRLLAFAHLPLITPDAAADELERCVRELNCPGALISGQTNGTFLDDPKYAPILARAEVLDVPVYIHPGVPPPAVRAAYYDGYSPELSQIFATSGWGWHAETAVHVLRMVLSGTFDKHPKLKVIIGHMGEGLPTMLDRCDAWLSPRAKHLSRGVGQTILDHVTITTAGFFTFAPFIAALLTFGVDRILFSVDYPFSKNAEAKAFLDTLPVTPADKEKIAHGNADRILKLT